jgi:hypothetical protein
MQMMDNTEFVNDGGKKRRGKRLLQQWADTLLYVTAGLLDNVTCF